MPGETISEGLPTPADCADATLTLPHALRAFIAQAITEQSARQDALRVDGVIIGTGESDFTKGNHTYQLQIDNKPFQLIDVPGIEGNEQLYGHYVDDAVARAHLVFYVNGTNKKPEVATLARMRRICIAERHYAHY